MEDRATRAFYSIFRNKDLLILITNYHADGILPFLVVPGRHQFLGEHLPRLRQNYPEQIEKEVKYLQEHEVIEYFDVMKSISGEYLENVIFEVYGHNFNKISYIRHFEVLKKFANMDLLLHRSISANYLGGIEICLNQMEDCHWWINKERRMVYEQAIRGDAQNIVKLYFKIGIMPKNGTTGFIATYGTLEMMKLFHAQKVPFTDYCFAMAAKKGKLDMLKWLYDNVKMVYKHIEDYPYYTSYGPDYHVEDNADMVDIEECSAYVLGSAKEGGHLDVLQYLVERAQKKLG